MRRDPKKSGVDLRWAKRIARRHGPDIVRRQEKTNFIREVMGAKQRRMARRQAEEQHALMRKQQIVNSSIDRQRQNEELLQTRWYQEQLQRLMKEAISKWKEAAESKREQYLRTLQALERVTYEVPT